MKCQKPNVRKWEKVKIRTFDCLVFGTFKFRTFGNSEHVRFGFLGPIVQNQNNLVQILDVFCLDFGFCQIWPYWRFVSDSFYRPKSEQNCLDFGRCPNTESSGTGPKVKHPTTKLVRFSDLYCIVFILQDNLVIIS